MSKVKIPKLMIDKNEFLNVEYKNVQDALLHMIYMKTGLLFMKPETGPHALVPDNLREFQNVMVFLNKMENVVDLSKKLKMKILLTNEEILGERFVKIEDEEKEKIIKEQTESYRSIHLDNLNEFKNYFYNAWTNKNLKWEHEQTFNAFLNEPIENKNKFVYQYLRKYLDDNSTVETGQFHSDSVQPYNISMADVFDIMSHIEMKNELGMLISAIGIEYSMLLMELIYLRPDKYNDTSISDLIHGKIFEFVSVEEKYYNDTGKVAEYLGDVRDSNIGNLKILNPEEDKNPVLKTQIFNFIKKGEYMILSECPFKVSEGNNDYRAAVSELCKSIAYIYFHLVTYYGYRADSFDNPICKLGHKYYRPSYSGKTKKYTLAQTGIFSKMLVLSELLNDIFDIKSDEEDEMSSDEQSNFKGYIDILLDQSIISSCLAEVYDGEKPLLKTLLETWVVLIGDMKILFPYQSFEFMQKMSSTMKSRSLSLWRRDGKTSYDRYIENFYDLVLESYNTNKKYLQFENVIMDNVIERTQKIDSPIELYSKGFIKLREVFNPVALYSFWNTSAIKSKVTSFRDVEELLEKLDTQARSSTIEKKIKEIVEYFDLRIMEDNEDLFNDLGKYKMDYVKNEHRDYVKELLEEILKLEPDEAFEEAVITETKK